MMSGVNQLQICIQRERNTEGQKGGPERRKLTYFMTFECIYNNNDNNCTVKKNNLTKIRMRMSQCFDNAREFELGLDCLFLEALSSARIPNNKVILLFDLATC